MKQDRLSKNNLILYASGLIPVIWFALLTAPYMGEGLVGIIENLSVEACANRVRLNEEEFDTLIKDVREVKAIKN